MDRYNLPDSTVPNNPTATVLDRRRHFLQNFAPSNNIEPAVNPAYMYRPELLSQVEISPVSPSSPSSTSTTPSTSLQHGDTRVSSVYDEDDDDDNDGDEDQMLMDEEVAVPDRYMAGFEMTEEGEEEYEGEGEAELGDIEYDEVEEVNLEDEETIGDEEMEAEADRGNGIRLGSTSISRVTISPVRRPQPGYSYANYASQVSSSSVAKPSTSLISISSPASQSGIKLQIRRAPQQHSSKPSSISERPFESQIIDSSDEGSTDSDERELLDSPSKSTVYASDAIHRNVTIKGIHPLPSSDFDSDDDQRVNQLQTHKHEEDIVSAAKLAAFKRAASQRLHQETARRLAAEEARKKKPAGKMHIAPSAGSSTGPMKIRFGGQSGQEYPPNYFKKNQAISIPISQSENYAPTANNTRLINLSRSVIIPEKLLRPPPALMKLIRQEVNRRQAEGPKKNTVENVPDLLPISRPRKNRVVELKEEEEEEDSTNLSTTLESLESTEDETSRLDETPTSSIAEGTRRTSRKRKPTTPYVSELGGPRKRKKDAFEHEDTDSNRSRTKDDGERGALSFSFKAIGEANITGTSSEVSSTRVPKRIRTPGGTGRGRGRPRGSTLKNRMPHDAAMASVEDIVDVVLSQASADSESEQSSSPKKSRSRGAGGKVSVKPPRKPYTRKNKKPAQKQLLQVFDEETLMTDSIITKSESRNSYETESGSNTMVFQSAGDDDPQISSSNMSSTNTSVTGATKNKKTVKDLHFRERIPVTADTLFEYPWPLEENAERFMLQEQVCEYLQITSFKRKYPSFSRRPVDMAERDYLRENKIVTETQCDLGLTALNSNDVMNLMMADFPEKYNAFCSAIRARIETKKLRAALIQAEKAVPVRDRSAEYLSKIKKSVSKWNSALNADRKLNRSYSTDLQTRLLHIQEHQRLKQILPPEMTAVGFYPIPTLPGQYVDVERVRRYTPSELKYLPLNTATFGPLNIHPKDDPESEDSESDSDDTTSSDDSSSSSDEDIKVETSDNEKLPASKCTPVVGVVEGENSKITCKTCEGDVVKNKDGIAEVLIQCTKCDIANHPSCLELSLDMLPYIRKYNWQCTECKNCIECNDPADEDKMLFCDLCDRGYHIYCVGLRRVPTGRWHCRVCANCYSCGSKRPSLEDRLAEWHHEFKKGEKNAKQFLHSHCVSCHKVFKKGLYCPTCLKCHLKFDEKDLIECRTCEKWVHRECVKKSFQTMSAMFGFRCDTCETLFKSRSKMSAMNNTT